MGLRPAGPPDLGFLTEMLYQSIFVPPGEPPPARTILDELRIAHYLLGWGRTGDFALIAECEERLAGAAWQRFMPSDHPGFGYVAEDVPEIGIALEPWARGQGVGTRLIAELVAHARSDGIRALSLSVDPRNPALRLYQRLGWTKVRAVDGSWTMLKRL